MQNNPKKTVMPAVIWITGLSSSGKTTLANNIAKSIRAKYTNVILLDGDLLRDALGENKDYSKEGRLKLAFKYSKIAKLLSQQNQIVIIATIALHHEIHAWNRANIENYIEIYLDVPIEILRSRDPKGLYQRFFSGEISNLTGLDIPADFPLNPHIVINDSGNITPTEICDSVKKQIENLINL